LHGCNNAEIGGCATFGNIGDLYEIHGFGPFLVTVALSKATNFVGIGALPKGTFAALAEFVVLSKFAGVGIERIAMEGNVVRGACVRAGACGGKNYGTGGGGEVTQSGGKACSVIVVGNSGRCGAGTRVGARQTRTRHGKDGGWVFVGMNCFGCAE
jgi:hypothetical protein